MRSIRNRRKAQEQWDKLRKYVNFTWGRGLIPSEDGVFVENACCNCFPNLKGGSSFNQRKQIRMDNLSFNTKVSTPSEKGLRDVKEKSSMHWNNADTSGQQEVLADIALPPSLEMRGAGSEISIPEIQKNLENIYEYNMMLREKLVIAQSMIHTLTSKASASDQIHQ